MLPQSFKLCPYQSISQIISSFQYLISFIGSVIGMIFNFYLFLLMEMYSVLCMHTVYRERAINLPFMFLDYGILPQRELTGQDSNQGLFCRKQSNSTTNCNTVQSRLNKRQKIKLNKIKLEVTDEKQWSPNPMYIPEDVSLSWLLSASCEDLPCHMIILHNAL